MNASVKNACGRPRIESESHPGSGDLLTLSNVARAQQGGDEAEVISSDVEGKEATNATLPVSWLMTRRIRE